MSLAVLLVGIFDDEGVAIATAETVFEYNDDSVEQLINGHFIALSDNEWDWLD